jgi:hypothetical protein
MATASGFAAANAQGRDTAPAAGFLQGVHQRHHDPRAGGADRVTLGAGAAVHVDLVVIESWARMASIVTMAKASLISNRSTSPTPQPVAASSFSWRRPGPG